MFNVALSFLGLALTCAVGALSMMWSPGHEVWGLRLLWAAVFFGACCAGCFMRRLFKGSASERPPLEVIFDKRNPGNTFWSKHLAKDQDGNPKSPAVWYWEYRATIRNTSSKTVRNAAVTTEWVGKHPNLPHQPAGDQEFQKNHSKLINIKPNCEEVVRIHVWWYPAIQAGNFTRWSISWYGRLQVTASGDDVLPTIGSFKFNPEIEPMLFDWAFQS